MRLMHPMRTFDNLVEWLLWQICVPYRHTSVHSTHVDLGSGRFVRNPFLASQIIGTDISSGIDLYGTLKIIQVDLTRKLPFEDNSIDSFSAYDVLEHIPRWERFDEEIQYPFITLMSEISRCLKPGGVFLAATPAFPSPVAFKDPTHVNIISETTLEYFTGNLPIASELGYGFKGNFEYQHQSWLHTRTIWDQESLAINLISASVQRRIFFLLRYDNIVKIIDLIVSCVFRRPSHLLWVLRKPR